MMMTFYIYLLFCVCNIHWLIRLYSWYIIIDISDGSRQYRLFITIIIREVFCDDDDMKLFKWLMTLY